MCKEGIQSSLRSQLSDFIIIESDPISEEDEISLRQNSFQSLSNLREQESYGSSLKQSKSQNLVNKQIFSKYLFKQRINKRRSLKIFKNQLIIKAQQLCRNSSSSNLTQQINLEKKKQLINEEKKVTLNNIKNSRVFKQRAYLQQNMNKNKIQNNQVQEQLLQIEQKYQIYFEKTKKFQIQIMSNNQSNQEESKNQNMIDNEKEQKEQKIKSDEQTLLKYVMYFCLSVCMIAIIQTFNNIRSKGL